MKLLQMADAVRYERMTTRSCARRSCSKVCSSPGEIELPMSISTAR